MALRHAFRPGNPHAIIFRDAAGEDVRRARRPDTDTRVRRRAWSKVAVMPTRIITERDFVQSVADAVQFISYYHPADYIRHLAAAYARKRRPAAPDAMAQILTNSRMCAEGHRPVCQDTGIVNVFIRMGVETRLQATRGLQELCDAGVRRGYTRKLMRWASAPRVSAG